VETDCIHALRIYSFRALELWGKEMVMEVDERRI